MAISSKIRNYEYFIPEFLLISLGFDLALQVTRTVLECEGSLSIEYSPEKHFPGKGEVKGSQIYIIKRGYNVGILSEDHFRTAPVKIINLYI